LLRAGEEREIFVLRPEFRTRSRVEAHAQVLKCDDRVAEPPPGGAIAIRDATA